VSVRELSVGGCRRIELPKIHDDRGNLTFVESDAQIPFAIGRVFWLYDVPGGEHRAGHAHARVQQLIVAASGSFDVAIDDGTSRDRITLDRSDDGLYVPPLVWVEVDDFTSGAVCLVICSLPYDETDYHRDYDRFLEVARDGRR
jgi:hypothetical protein